VLNFLNNILSDVTVVDNDLKNEAKAHLDNLTKPVGSLGRLEELAQRLYAINGGKTPLTVDPALMFVVAGDHGVAEENVSSFPQEVTRLMVANFLASGAGINVLCKNANMDIQIIDTGCVGGIFEEHDMLLNCSFGPGTKNMIKEPAMTQDTCLKGLLNGIELAKIANIAGKKCVGIGEMGIANTTAATALFCAFLNLDPEIVTGPGAGLSAEKIKHKVTIVQKALELHKKCIEDKDVIAILAALGGFEIVVMAGIILGAAQLKIPILIDGFISTSAFTAARALCPAVADYCILTHYSAEPGYKHVIDALGVEKPLLNLDMRLGEGTGAALALNIIRASAEIFNDMATFEQAEIKV